MFRKGLSTLAKTMFRVTRVDNNGNRFKMASGLTREQAEEMADKFEKRGHKQAYIAEEDMESQTESSIRSERYRK